MNIDLIQENVSDLAQLLKTIANDKRLHIVCLLHTGEKNVSELEQLVGLSQSALSQHLARLRREKIVTTRRDAQTIYYTLSNRAIYELLNCMCGILEADMHKSQNR